MSVPRPARPHYRKPALCACQRQPSGVPIQRAGKGRLFDQQYQDRFDKDYGAASAALLGSRFDVVRETFGRQRAIVGLIVLATLTVPIQSVAQTPPPVPIMPPSLPAAHVVNLMTNEGSGAFGVQWRVADIKMVEVPAPINKDRYKTTYQIEPRAMATDFDDSQWERIEGKDLGVRRSGGHNAFMWFRGLLIMPARVGDFDPSKPAMAVLNVLVDDYAEVWINGQMPRRSGYPSPATIRGLNMPNRVVLGTEVKAGDKFQIAVFAINGPISDPFGSIWFRQAMLEFYR
jgi:gluconolactonase